MNQNAEELKSARIAAGLTPMQAANLVHVDKRTWQRYESGTSQIPGAIVELFQIKTKPENVVQCSRCGGFASYQEVTA